MVQIDLTSIRNACGTQINVQTGMRVDAQARDQVSPPMIVILPGAPPVVYGVTMGSPGNPGAVTVNLILLVILSDAPPVEKTQRAADVYLGTDSGETASVHNAILADPTLGKVVEWCIPVNASSYGRLEYAGQGYFGTRVNLSIGAR